jgi:hypothetical protein
MYVAYCIKCKRKFRLTEIDTNLKHCGRPVVYPLTEFFKGQPKLKKPENKK